MKHSIGLTFGAGGCPQEKEMHKKGHWANGANPFPYGSADPEGVFTLAITTGDSAIASAVVHCRYSGYRDQA